MVSSTFARKRPVCVSSSLHPPSDSSTPSEASAPHFQDLRLYERPLCTFVASELVALLSTVE